MSILTWLANISRRGPDNFDNHVDFEFEAADGELDPYDPFPDPVHLELTDVFDLHALQPRDIECAVVEYLFEARRSGFNSVRIIHGKGIGRQRELVRRILSNSEFVLSYSDAPPNAGGWGATVAHLSQS